MNSGLSWEDISGFVHQVKPLTGTLDLRYPYLMTERQSKEDRYAKELSEHRI